MPIALKYKIFISQKRVVKVVSGMKITYEVSAKLFEVVFVTVSSIYRFAAIVET